MYLRYWLFLFLGAVKPVLGANAEWFVAVYSENYQHIVGAAATPGVPAGVFLKPDFVGKVMYVRSKKGYELDQFRPKGSDNTTNTDGITMSESATDVAVEPPKENVLKTEFGPLVDTGLQYHVNGDFKGWYCDNLFVLPMGEGVYRLRCDKDMQHE